MTRSGQADALPRVRSTTSLGYPQVAIYRARALNAAAGSSQGIQHADYFQSYNEAIQRCYLHAAAVSGRDIATVRQWVNRAESHDAIRCLRESPAAPGCWRRRGTWTFSGRLFREE